MVPSSFGGTSASVSWHAPAPLEKRNCPQQYCHTPHGILLRVTSILMQYPPEVRELFALTTPSGILVGAPCPPSIWVIAVMRCIDSQ